MTIDAQLAPQHVFFSGMTKATIEEGNRKITVEQPRFLTNKISTNITTRSGQHLLLANFSAPDQPDSTELFIYQATAKPITK